jgi:hypothetical protein
MSSDEQLESLERLEEIEREIGALVEEASDVIRGFGERPYERAKSYWIAHIKMALNKEHDYLGGSMVTLADTRKELEGMLEDDDEEELERCDALRGLESYSPSCTLPAGHAGAHKWGSNVAPSHDEQERHPCETDGWNEQCSGCHHTSGGCPFEE